MVFAIIIVLINGFFVIAEYGLRQSRRARLEEMAEVGNEKAQLALKILDRQADYSSTVQFGITACSVLLGFVGAFVFNQFIVSHIEIDSLIILMLAWLALVIIQVVLGELVPRIWAIRDEEYALMATSYPLVCVRYFFYPIVWLTRNFSALTRRVLGIKKPEDDIARSEDELRAIVTASAEKGEIDDIEGNIIDNVFDFADTVAREIMVPRQDMLCMFTDETLEENLNLITETRHTRYPLCEGEKDNVIGYVHITDLFRELKSDTKSIDLKTIMRPIVIVPEALPVSKIMEIMQAKHVQIVLVADEYGGTAGLITMEDVVEELVGDFDTEQEAREPDEIVEHENGYCEFDGMVLLDDISEMLNISFEDADEDTIGGYVFGTLGRKPELGDTVKVGNYSFTVTGVEGFRVLRVDAKPIVIKGTEGEA